MLSLAVGLIAAVLTYVVVTVYDPGTSPPDLGGPVVVEPVEPATPDPTPPGDNGESEDG